jgi:hypothetical protein
MKTPLQELIEWIELNIDDNDFIKHEVLEEADKKLKEEKDHIMMAFNDGRVNGLLWQKKTADQYYKLTYKPETI